MNSPVFSGIPKSGWRDFIPAHTHIGTVRPQLTCLVLVDLQHATGSGNHGLAKQLQKEGRQEDGAYRFGRIKESVIPRAGELLSFFRNHDLPRLFVTYGAECPDYSDLPRVTKGVCSATDNAAGNPEHEILPEVSPVSGELVLNKRTASAFNSTPIELILHTWKIETLVFAGVATNMCVEHSLRDAADRGFYCILAEDACAADSPDMHEATLKVIPRLYGSVASTNGIIAQLRSVIAAPGDLRPGRECGGEAERPCRRKEML